MDTERTSAAEQFEQPRPAPSSKIPNLASETLPPRTVSVVAAQTLPAEAHGTVISLVAGLTQSYALAGDFVLPQSEEKIGAALREGRLVVAQNLAGAVVGAAKWIPLMNRFGVEIVELGSLVRVLDGVSYASPSPVARCVQFIVDDMRGRGALVVATARAERSGRCLSAGGMKLLRWSEVPALAALSCDPGCAPSSAGEKAWTGCESSVTCAARALPGNTRSDACSLYVSDMQRAREIQEMLDKNPEAQHGGCFSARRLRERLGLPL